MPRFELLSGAVSGASKITIQNGGAPLSTTANTINFTGAGVIASGSGSTITVTVSGFKAGTLAARPAASAATTNMLYYVNSGASSGNFYYSDGSSWFLFSFTGGGANLNLNRTAVKTANYSAVANDLVPVDTTSGAVTVTLPTAPANQTMVAIKLIIVGVGNTVTIAPGGSDVFNRAGGPTTLVLTLTNQGYLLVYDSATAIWTLLADNLPLSGLDARYVQLGGDIGNTTASPQVTNLHLAADTAVNHKLTTVTDPTNPQDAATKNYVDSVASALNPAVAVQAATTQASDTSSFTYNNGVSGIGATLTGAVNTAVSWDGFTFTALGQRGLVKNDTQSPSGAFNGVYYVTQVQTAILPPILTRALDYDQPSDINNTGAIPVVNGTVNASTSWLLTSSVTTVGTSPLTYTQFSISPSNLATLTGPQTITNTTINETQAGDLASAGTVNIGAATGNYLQITGTTTITAFDTIQAGTRRVVKFTGALTLTNNGTSLILPGGANITTVAGDVATFISLGSGNWVCTNYSKITVTGTGSTVLSAAPAFTGTATGSRLDLSGQLSIANQQPFRFNGASDNNWVMERDSLRLTNTILTNNDFTIFAGGASGEGIAFGAGGTSTPTMEIDTTLQKVFIKGLTRVQSLQQNLVSKSTTYTALTTDSVILVSASSPWTLALYTAVGNTGLTLTIKKTDANSVTNAITVDPNSTETIDGVTTWPLYDQYEVLTIISDGTNWQRI